MSISGTNRNSPLCTSASNGTESNRQPGGQQLFQQALQSHQREALVKHKFEQSSPGSQSKLADEFVEAAGKAGINAIADTPDGQYALRTVYDYASKGSQKVIEDAHKEQGSTAVDYTYSLNEQDQPVLLRSMEFNSQSSSRDNQSSTNTSNKSHSALDIISEEFPKWANDASNSIRNDFKQLSDNITQSQLQNNDFYEKIKDESVASGNLPKYMLASFGQSASNLGHNAASFSANLVGNREQAEEQWSEFKEYSLEASEDTNAIEVESSVSINYFGIQVGLGVAFGVDNQGRVDLALSGNFEPNTDVMGVEAIGGVNVAKAWQVDSVKTLLDGHSTAIEGFVSGQLVVGGELSHGQGYLYTSKGDIAFSQMGAAITLEDPIESPVWAGVSVDDEYAYSASSGDGFDLGWFGKALYGALNITYGNSLDELALHKGIR